MYQSLDRELQKHVSHQDTLQQCQTWLSTVYEELNDQPPSGLQEALKQVNDQLTASAPLYSYFLSALEWYDTID